METVDRIVFLGVDELRGYPGNARKHDKKQVSQIAESIRRFGFVNPILIDGYGQVICGHGRLAAARLLGLLEVPTISVAHLSKDELRAYALADNQIALNAMWDNELLGVELQHLLSIDFDLAITGFSTTEVDLVFTAGNELSNDEPPIPPLPSQAVSQAGDLWFLGDHRLICGDAQDIQTFKTLMDGELAEMCFTDPPYDLTINGHVSGLGKHQHREFAFASGEMGSAEFTTFLSVTLAHAGLCLRDGAIAFVCMDWRHVGELLQAGELVLGEYKQLCVWNKTNAGMGTFYRSKHELIFVFKVGTAPHINNFGLGDTGRYRTNVWDYPGMSSPTKTRDAELAMHPTVKPVKLVEDALLDCSHRGGVVLDCFGGSGTTLIAAEQAGRKARLVEIDPRYCDTIISRFEQVTGKQATLGQSGSDFKAVAQARAVQLERV